MFLQASNGKRQRAIPIIAAPPASSLEMAVAELQQEVHVMKNLLQAILQGSKDTKALVHLILNRVADVEGAVTDVSKMRWWQVQIKCGGLLSLMLCYQAKVYPALKEALIKSKCLTDKEISTIVASVATEHLAAELSQRNLTVNKFVSEVWAVVCYSSIV